MSRWSEYIPLSDYYAREVGVPLREAVQTVGKVIEEGVRTGKLQTFEMVSYLAERNWTELGRPSYRVSTALAEALVETDLDIQAKHIRFPHSVFGIEIPRGFTLLNAQGRRLLGLLVTATRLSPTGDQAGAYVLGIEAPDGEGPWGFTVCQTWEGEEETPATFRVRLDPDDVVGERLKEMTTKRVDDAVTVPESRARLVALALGAALFAVGANSKFVRPIQAGGKRQGRKAHNRPPEPRRWSLGADIVLPRRGKPAGPTEPTEGSGRSLQWAHVRQGHLRLVPTGPRSERTYVLRYIAPTVVRPDLPLAPRATRHLLDQGGQ